MQYMIKVHFYQINSQIDPQIDDSVIIIPEIIKKFKIQTEFRM